jgi:phage protein D
MSDELQEIEKRNYCAQYNESDLDFVSRLAKRDGVSYYFKDNIQTKTQITTPQIVIPGGATGEMATKELINQYEIAEAKTVEITNKIKSNIEEKTNLKERIANLRVQIDTTYDRATKVTLEKEISALEARLATLDELTQKMQLELQDAMNKQQQAFNMISNIMKSFHDTAKSMINNLR